MKSQRNTKHKYTMTGNAMTSEIAHPIQDRMVQLHTNLSELAEVLTILEDGLSPILSGIPELEDDTPKTLVNCKLESELAQASTRVCGMIQKVRLMHTRNQL